MTVYPCFTELHSRMFHLAKLAMSENPWYYVICQHVTAATEVGNVNITVFTELSSFMDPCSCESEELDAYGQPFWSPISIADQLKIEVAQWCILKCF